MYSKILIILTIGALSRCDERHPDVFKNVARTAGGEIEDPSFWTQNAQQDLNYRLTEELRIKEAKNVIFFLGDGWSVSTIIASRILKGQERDNAPFGEEATLHVDTLTHTGLSKTFCVDAQTADSACSVTAYLGGVKANEGTVGVNSNVNRYNCTAEKDPVNQVASILLWAQEAGKSTGVVSTAALTDASGAGTFAHTSNRDWECDADIRKHPNPEFPELCNAENTNDIAKQLVIQKPGRDFNVILAGGRDKFLPITVNDTEGTPGQREDGRHLINEWFEGKPSETSVYIEKKDDLLKVNATSTDYLVGLFASGHIAYYHEQEANEDPSLAEMTRKAIEILSKNPKGYFLFVEGGRIDMAHHGNQGLRAAWEAVEFDLAIETGDKMTDDENTLILVTADHSHPFMLNGYAPRGSKISGFGGVGLDELPFSVMNYANGPGFKPFTNNQRHNISTDDVENVRNTQVPLVHLGGGSHAGEDVMIYAKGPFSHLFSGVHLQSYIPHAIGYASCLGPGLTYCGEGVKSR